MFTSSWDQLSVPSDITTVQLEISGFVASSCELPSWQHDDARLMLVDAQRRAPDLIMLDAMLPSDLLSSMLPLDARNLVGDGLRFEFVCPLWASRSA